MATAWLSSNQPTRDVSKEQSKLTKSIVFWLKLCVFFQYLALEDTVLKCITVRWKCSGSTLIFLEVTRISHVSAKLTRPWNCELILHFFKTSWPLSPPMSTSKKTRGFSEFVGFSDGVGWDIFFEVNSNLKHSSLACDATWNRWEGIWMTFDHFRLGISK